MNKSRFWDGMDIHAVESKLNDVTAIPKSRMSTTQKYGHQSNANASLQSTKPQKNQYTAHQQIQLLQSAIKMVQQQQLQQQLQQ